MSDAALVDRVTATLERWCAQPGDTEDVRSRRSHFALAFALILPAGLVWAGLYLAFGAAAAAAAPFSYVVLTGASFVVLRRTRNFRLFQLTQTTLILFVPLALQLVLGGFVGGSAAAAWCLLAPLFAVLVTSRREAVVWFALFAAALTFAAVVQPGLDVTNPLPQWLITALFVMNLTGPSIIAFAMLLSFVQAEEHLRALERSYLQQNLMLRQSEKLATLGTLAAGVAHELNNPAAAVTRAADQAKESIRELQESCVELSTLALTRDQAGALGEMCAADSDTRALAPLERASREDEIESWLTDRGVNRAWELSPLFVDHGHTPEGLARALAGFTDEQLPVACAALGRGLTSRRLVADIAEGAGRISEIVSAMRSYSYLDQGTKQVVDITDGLESTLVLLRSKLADMTVERHYEPDLPHVPVRGSELNQVWTNIIDNACDATRGKGTLIIRTGRTADSVVVEIEDDGPGMPPEVVEHVFDPFFTTKEPGMGTGLGMNISHNIVVAQHHGTLAVTSAPGATRFRVELPIKPPPGAA